MIYRVKIFTDWILFIYCVIAIIACIFIFIDGYVSLGDLPFKNGYPKAAPLFGDIDSVYTDGQSEGITPFVRNGITNARKQIYVTLVLLPLLVSICLSTSIEIYWKRKKDQT